jgi:Cdc6-like AAA superfamily ATPase
MSNNKQSREMLLSVSFTPSTPIHDATLFKGRKEQQSEMMAAIMQTGQHVLLFGERGVGKTSMANVLGKTSMARGSLMSIRVNCDSNDDFKSTWAKVAGEIHFLSESHSVGFGSKRKAERVDARQLLGDGGPNEVRKLLTMLANTGAYPFIVIDEFDRVKKASSVLFADTIKMLSDHGVGATLVLVGVADSVDELMKGHASVERALKQILMPRMSPDEIREIVTGGLANAGMSAESRAVEQIVRLAQGLPHYGHLLGQNAGMSAAASDRTLVTSSDVLVATRRAVEKAQESIKSAHYTATVSPRKESIYGQVLLACALAKPDQRGFFPAADIREPLSNIMGKRYEIPAFSQHLNDFCDKKRGPILQKTGSARRYRFRFLNPLMQPYVIMDGISKGLLSQQTLEEPFGE